jgi:hypothetical protein
VLPGDAPLIIEPGRTTIASVLHDAGYKTGIIGNGTSDWALQPDWNGDIKPGPLELGFDYCFLMPATGDRVPCVYVENHRVVGLDPRDPLKVSFKEYVGNEPTGKDHPELLDLQPSHGHDQTIVNGVSRIGYMSGAKAARWSDEDMADTYVRKRLHLLTSTRANNSFSTFPRTTSMYRAGRIRALRANRPRTARGRDCGV